MLRTSPRPAAHALLVQALAAQDVLEDACSAAAAAVQAFPCDGQTRYLHAVVLLELGRHVDAVGQARAAVYLEPRLAEAHLLLGRCHQVAGDLVAAQRSRTAGLQLLELSSQ